PPIGTENNFAKRLTLFEKNPAFSDSQRQRDQSGGSIQRGPRKAHRAPRPERGCLSRSNFLTPVGWNPCLRCRADQPRVSPKGCQSLAQGWCAGGEHLPWVNAPQNVPSPIGFPTPPLAHPHPFTIAPPTLRSDAPIYEPRRARDSPAVAARIASWRRRLKCQPHESDYRHHRIVRPSLLRSGSGFARLGGPDHSHEFRKRATGHTDDYGSTDQRSERLSSSRKSHGH